MSFFHPILQAVLSNIAHPDSTSRTAVETIAYNLGIEQQHKSSQSATTLLQVIIDRVNSGDWVFFLKPDFLHTNNINALQAVLPSFLSDPRIANKCAHETDADGKQFVRIPMNVWIDENAPSYAKKFAETGVDVSLVLTRAENDELLLTRIEVNALNVYSTYQRTQNRTE